MPSEIQPPFKLPYGVHDVVMGLGRLMGELSSGPISNRSQRRDYHSLIKKHRDPAFANMRWMVEHASKDARTLRIGQRRFLSDEPDAEATLFVLVVREAHQVGTENPEAPVETLMSEDQVYIISAEPGKRMFVKAEKAFSKLT